MQNTGGGSGILGNLDLHHILDNIILLVGPFTKMVLAVSFVAGIIFVFKGVAMLHHFGQPQNMMSRPHSLTGPFIYMGIGAILLYMPATTNIFSLTLLGDVSMLFPDNDVIEIVGDNGATYSVNTSPQYNENASNELMTYVKFGIAEEWSKLINTIVIYIQLIGFIAFVRGWFILASVASPGGAQQGAFSKGIIHIIGGIIAINFVPFMKVIATIIF